MRAVGGNPAKSFSPK